MDWYRRFALGPAFPGMTIGFRRSPMGSAVAGMTTARRIILLGHLR
jgi:hypothetical protein